MAKALQCSPHFCQPTPSRAHVTGYPVKLLFTLVQPVFEVRQLLTCESCQNLQMGVEGMRMTTKKLGTTLKEWANVIIFYINTPQLFE